MVIVIFEPWNESPFWGALVAMATQTPRDADTADEQ